MGNNQKKMILALGVLMMSLAGCGVLDLTGLSVEPAAPAPGSTAAPAPLMPSDTEPAAGLLDFEQNLVAIYEAVNPSVVFIDVSSQVEQAGLTDYGSGSGFVYDSEGHIITNNHVIDGADEIRVTFADGSVFPADLVGADVYSDLAVLKVDFTDGFSVAPLALGDSDSLKVGQFVIAIGNPFGLSGTMTTGIVSALGRTIPTQETAAGTFSNPLMIQTDTAINPGNSGGPLLDSGGRVIGVNSAIRTTDGNNTGVGFAIPVSTVKIIVPQLIADGEVAYPYMGIESNTAVSLADLALEYDLPTTSGVLIANVVPGGPADKAGLRGGTEIVSFRGYRSVLGGDIIVAIDGVPIHTFDELLGYLVTQKRAGEEVVVTIYRGTEMVDVILTLERR